MSHCGAGRGFRASLVVIAAVASVAIRVATTAPTVAHPVRLALVVRVETLLDGAARAVCFGRVIGSTGEATVAARLAAAHPIGAVSARALRAAHTGGAERSVAVVAHACPRAVAGHVGGTAFAVGVRVYDNGKATTIRATCLLRAARRTSTGAARLAAHAVDT